ncbi:MAG: DUF6067 family protein [Kiritimatiellae bacterium]|nr:DUF6067 family protein [Kiritimatiellia bacterium]
MSTQFRHPARSASATVLGLAAAIAIAAKAGEAPLLTVPRRGPPPSIDGTIGEAEWKHAAAITGFVLMQNHRLDPRQAVAYVTYDDRMLYMAFKLPVYPPGARLLTTPLVRDSMVFGNDYLDVILNPDQYGHDRHYQFVGNSKDDIAWDTSPDGLGFPAKAEWDGRWEFKNRVAADRWDAELAIPLEDLDQKKPIADGTQWLAHFTRIWGAMEAGWPAMWTTLSPTRVAETTSQGVMRFDCTTGARLVFDSGAPTVRLLSVAPLLQGRFGFRGEIVNGATAVDLRIEATVLSDKGAPLATKIVTAHLNPGETLPLEVDEAAALTDNNGFSLKVTAPASGKTYFQQSFTFARTPETPVFPKTLNRAFDFEVRYQPSFQRLWVDAIDFSSLAERKRVRQVRIDVSAGINTPVIGKALFSTNFPAPSDPLRNFAIGIPGIIPYTEAPGADPWQGAYDVRCALLDGDGAALSVVTNEIPWNKEPWTEFTTHGQTIKCETGRWKTDPWIGCTAGLSDAILAPYTPLKAASNHVSLLGRDYLVGPLGLFDQMTATQTEPTVGKATEPLLARPMALLWQDGRQRKSVEAVKPSSLSASDERQAVFDAEGQFGDTRVRIRSTIEYDGFAWIGLELIPRKPTTIAGLTLDIPLREEQATLLHEVPESIRRGYSGALPAGNGRVWDSLRTKNKALRGSFKPLYWLGNEDRGLSWCGESDRGWHLDDTQPAIEILRESGHVILRLNLIGAPLQLTASRTIEFGFEATPMKPLPPRWRSMIFPYYGHGLTQGLARLQNLKRFSFQILYLCLPEFAPYPFSWDYPRNSISNYAGAGVTLFTYQDSGVCSSVAGANPEFVRYRGEWARAKGHGASSYRDFRAWSLREMLTRCGLHAFYEDNAYLTPTEDASLGYGFTRDDGRAQPEFLIRPLRALLKRDAAVYQELGLPNYAAVHKSSAMLPPCFAFTTFAIDGEVRFMDTVDRDYIDNFPLDYIRSHIMGRQFGVVPMFLSEIKLDAVKQRDAVLRGTRSELALLLLHEIPIWPAGGMDTLSLTNAYRWMNDFDIGSTDVAYHPYWAQDPAATVSATNVEISVWSRPGKAVAVAANLGGAQSATIQFNPAALGFLPKTILDYESQTNVPMRVTAIDLPISRHDYRLLWLEP